MREVKVRGWDGMKMYYFDVALYMAFNEEAQDDMCPSSASQNLMLHTGLDDENGKDIYVGDIVLDRNEPATGMVELSYGSFIVNWHGPDIDDLRDYHEFLEVIGNIYENPELMEEASL
ncbi:YopX family protein [Brevibacillus laterosporus]|uniref:YopX family protein n=1 Tax=Brevibacillus laterosporus TaxID=1465 RepID=UPI00037BE8BE|nr:YopX family protein [Brevibacillus laterosporus]MED2004764.1 YopX family protein [Brevibacillus laterosporus]